MVNRMETVWPNQAPVSRISVSEIARANAEEQAWTAT